MADRPVCLVIGSNCFTGSHFVDGLLEEGQYSVIGVSRSPEAKSLYLPYKARRTGDFHFQHIDLVREFRRLAELIKEVRPRVVINVAALSEVALSNERPLGYFETNAVGVVRLCDFLRACPFLDRYVHISSAEIYGPCEQAVLEDAPVNPSTPYAVSKAAADLYLKTLMELADFPALIIRSTNVYGKHQQLYKIIPRTAIYLKQGKSIELHGGGKAVKSFIHIRDVVRGSLMALRRGQRGVYHFSVPSPKTVAEVVRQVCESMGHNFERATRIVGERLGQDSRYWLDCTKAGRELGWTAQVPFDAGVREVVDWVDANWAEIQKEPRSYVHKESIGGKDAA
jgi:dTDP-glucose 4,6-dehydratase